MRKIFIIALLGVAAMIVHAGRALADPSTFFTMSYSIGAAQWQNGHRIYPLQVIIHHTDPSSELQGRILFDARRMNTRQRLFSIRDSVQVEFPFSVNDIQNIIGNPAGIACLVSGHPLESKKVVLTPPMVLSSLLAGVDLPIQGQLLKKLYHDLQENEIWLQRFENIAPHLAENFAVGSFETVLAENWALLLQQIQSPLAELAVLSKSVREDTLQIIGRPFELPNGRQRDGNGEGESIVRQWYNQMSQSRFILSGVEVLRQLADSSEGWRQFLSSAIEGRRLEIVGGTWSDLFLPALSGESIVQQFLLGRKNLQFLKAECRVGCFPEIISQLPQILRQCGYQGLLVPISANVQTNQYRQRTTGPDGSAMTTVIAPDMERPPSLQEICPLLVGQYKAGFKHAVLMLPLADSSSWRTWQTLDHAAGLVAFPALRFSNASDLFTSDAVPTVTLRDTNYVHSFNGSFSFIRSQRMRLCEADLSEAELWAAVLKQGWSGTPLDSVRQQLLSMQDRAFYQGRGRENAIGHMAALHGSLHNMVASQLKMLSRSVHTQGKGLAVIVFNSLGWPRTALVSVAVPSGHNVKGVIDTDKKYAAFQVMDDTLCFVASDVPSMGYKTYWLQTGGREKEQMPMVKASEQFLENEFLRVEINAGNGQIQRFLDKRDNSDLWPAARTGNRLIASADSSSMEPVPCDKVESIRVIEASFQRGVRYTVSNSAVRLEVDYLVRPGVPQLEIRFRPLEWRAGVLISAEWPRPFQADSVECGAAFFCAPLRLDDRPRMIAGSDFLHLFNREKSLLIATPGYFCGRLDADKLTWNLLSPVDLALGDADASSTRGREINYLVQLESRRLSAVEASRLGQELRQPLVAVAEAGHDGVRPWLYSFFSCANGNMILSGAKPAEDGPGWILRLYQADGRPGKNVQLQAAESCKASRTDLFEQVTDSLRFRDGRVLFDCRPFEIVTIKGD